MRKGPVVLLLLCINLLVVLPSCRNDEYLTAPPPVPDQSFVEQFDTMQNAYNRGWRWLNRSQPVGPSTWTQIPDATLMTAYSSRGTSLGAAYADYLSTAGTNNGTISNWLVSPSLILQNGDKIVFYTKSQVDDAAGTDYGARLQVCINPTDDNLSTGTGDDPGKFKTVLLDINSKEDQYLSGNPLPTAYPGDWTKFIATVSGLNKPTQSRFAFRYYLHRAGSNGAGNAVGIDSVAYVGKK